MSAPALNKAGVDLAHSKAAKVHMHDLILLCTWSILSKRILCVMELDANLQAANGGATATPGREDARTSSKQVWGRQPEI